MNILGVCAYFQDHWNKFDFFLVMTSVLDTVILTWLPKSDGQGAVRVMAVLRIFRLFRLCRILRLLRAFKELWLLVKGLMEAMKTLVWTALLLFIILYMASIFIVQMVGENSDDWGEDKEQIDEWFGGMSESMFTLFQIMTMEGWGTIARTVMRVQPLMVFFFLVYLMVTSFAIMNLIIAVICESTFASASETEADISSIEDNEKLLMLQSLPRVFEESDLDMDGNISLPELRTAMSSRPDLFTHLVGEDGSTLLHDAEAIYNMLDMDGNGNVDLSELLAGFLRMKGFHDQEMEGLNLLVSLRSMKAELSELEQRIDDKYVDRPVFDHFGATQSTAASDAGTAFSGQTSEIAELKSSLQWVSWSRSRTMLGGEANIPSSDGAARSKSHGANGTLDKKEFTSVIPKEPLLEKERPPVEKERPAMPTLSIP